MVFVLADHPPNIECVVAYSDVNAPKAKLAIADLQTVYSYSS